MTSYEKVVPPSSSSQKNLNMPQPAVIKSPNSFIPSTFSHKAPPESNHATGVGENVYSSIMATLGTGLGVLGIFLGCCGCNPYREVGQGFVGVKSRFGNRPRLALCQLAHRIAPGYQRQNANW